MFVINFLKEGDSMKKNLMRMGMLVAIVFMLSGGVIAFAVTGSWSNVATTYTPKWGGVTFNNSVYSGKKTRDGNGSVYATAQETLLKHSIALTYSNYQGDKVIGSDWATAIIDQIEHPALYLTTYGTTFWSAAKSSDLEYTDNTYVSYRFSADDI